MQRRGALLPVTRKLKVLIVDDDPTTLLIAEARLQSAGHRVSTRDRAFGTSAAVLREKPDVVLLDIRMPGLPGDELGELLSSHGTAVILYSGEDEDLLKQHAQSCGSIGYICKSDSSEDFLQEFARLSAAIAEQHTTDIG